MALLRYLEEARSQPPLVRRLRILAFDPSLASRLETARMNEITVEIPWENVEAGPVGEYVEVVDYDPASGVFYYPIDLDDPHLLARDGLLQSESNPQFHQQMVYAVAMTTIKHFERALGRVALWGERRVVVNGEFRDQFVRRLRIYPHALRDRNAYYSPVRKALLFGYFPVTTKDRDNTPGTVVFTCLSHDVIAHEVTHALLDGVHPRFNEPTNPDVHGFHEAFADIVALFQHFTYPAVLEQQIRRTRGNLDSESLLAQLAQQFGRATGRGAALRDALGGTNPETGRWEARDPDPHLLDATQGAHARGAILVAAVFRAFLLVYRARTADLFRIATQGTGRLPEGEIHPDLTRRLAAEAAECADRVLRMCIRAIDYCPPVSITFGDFLRGIITADLDLEPADRSGFRIVFIEAFRDWGIYPHGITSMGLDALTWPTGESVMQEMIADGRLQRLPGDVGSRLPSFIRETAREWDLESDRYQVWLNLDRMKALLWEWLRGSDETARLYAQLLGLAVSDDAPGSIARGKYGPSVEVHSVRPSMRRTTTGAARTDLVIEITQRRAGYFDEARQAKVDASRPRQLKPDFWLRAGATLILDPVTSELRRIIRTTDNITSDADLARLRDFLQGGGGAAGNAFDGTQVGTGRNEPFAMLHLHGEE